MTTRKIPVIMTGTDWISLTVEEAPDRESAVTQAAQRWIDGCRESDPAFQVRLDPNGPQGSYTPNMSLRVEYLDAEDKWVLDSEFTVPDYEKADFG